MDTWEKKIWEVEGTFHLGDEKITVKSEIEQKYKCHSVTVGEIRRTLRNELVAKIEKCPNISFKCKRRRASEEESFVQKEAELEPEVEKFPGGPSTTDMILQCQRGGM